MDGKVDWMAFNLPVEGEAGPFVGSAVVDVLTCGPRERPADVIGRLGQIEGDKVVVVNDQRVVVGTVTVDGLEGAPEGATVLEILEPSPSTIRPSATISALNEKAAGLLVTSSDGVLLGVVDPAALTETDGDESGDEGDNESDGGGNSGEAGEG